MSAIDDLFQRLRAENRKTLMPFLTAGDPDLGTTSQAIEAFEELGCGLCEIGVPYSDPIADGPVIQASYTRALQRGITVDAILATLEDLKPRLSMPRVAMVSYAIIHRWGPKVFIERAKQAGVSGVIPPDLLADEAEAFREIARGEDFSVIHLVTPTTPRERAVRIAEQSTGFLYYVSVTGITGTRDALPERLVEDVAWLRERVSLPICIGFGVSKPEHVKTLAPVADGVIVGSALVRVLADESQDPQQRLARLRELVGSLNAALSA